MDEYYIKEIAKVLAIIDQMKFERHSDSGDVKFPELDYFKEKLERILNGIPIGIHPNLKPIIWKKLEIYSPSVSVVAHLDDGTIDWNNEEIVILSMAGKFDIYDQTINEKHMEEQNETRRKTI